MNRCEKLVNYLEENGFSSKDSEWQDIMAHAMKCPDCSLDLKNRKTMLEDLGEIDEPVYPKELHAFIMQGIETPEVPAETWLERIIEYSIRPLQIGLSLASVIMIFSLISLDRDQQTPVIRTARKPISSEIARRKTEVANASIRDTQLDEVSDEEVKDFLARLEKYRKNHDDVLRGRQMKTPLNIKLVVDR